MKHGFTPIALLAVLASVPAAASVPIRPGQSFDGELTSNDDQRRTGKYEDVYLLDGKAGDRIDLRLGSDHFDPQLLVSGPQGFAVSNDDEGAGSLASRLILQLPVEGRYRIAVTSFRPGETGTYRIGASIAAADAAAIQMEEARPIAIGSELSGRLAAGDPQLGTGEYRHRYRFTGRRGERVRADLASGKFDSYLILRRPDGSQDDNDDRGGEGRPTTDSRIDTVLAEDGDYVLVVTSFRPGETGDYRLKLDRSPGLARQNAVPPGPRVLALLVGVSDYGGRAVSLANTDRDAETLFGALGSEGLLHPASRLLTNKEATRERLQSAFAQAAAAAGPDDLFLFFFSGHGDQVDVGPDSGELDGRRETLELFDAALTDAELAPWFAQVRSRISLAVIDACYSGGFRNLVSQPNVMGLFSSEEDMTSLVAERFKAGGFLAYFLRSGLTGAADHDGDRIVTAGELATYVRRRFRKEGDIPAHTREDDRHFQNLLVERGGVHVDDVVVRLAPVERADGTPAVSSPESRAPAAIGKGVARFSPKKRDGP